MSMTRASAHYRRTERKCSQNLSTSCANSARRIARFPWEENHIFLLAAKAVGKKMADEKGKVIGKSAHLNFIQAIRNSLPFTGSVEKYMEILLVPGAKNNSKSDAIQRIENRNAWKRTWMSRVRMLTFSKIISALFTAVVHECRDSCVRTEKINSESRNKATSKCQCTRLQIITFESLLRMSVNPSSETSASSCWTNESTWSFRMLLTWCSNAQTAWIEPVEPAARSLDLWHPFKKGHRATKHNSWLEGRVHLAFLTCLAGTSCAFLQDVEHVIYYGTCQCFASLVDLDCNCNCFIHVELLCACPIVC